MQSEKNLVTNGLSAGPFNGTDYDVKKHSQITMLIGFWGKICFYANKFFYAAHNGATFAVTSTYNKNTGVLSVRSNAGGINGANYLYCCIDTNSSCVYNRI